MFRNPILDDPTRPDSNRNYLHRASTDSRHGFAPFPSFSNDRTREERSWIRAPLECISSRARERTRSHGRQIHGVNRTCNETRDVSRYEITSERVICTNRGARTAVIADESLDSRVTGFARNSLEGRNFASLYGPPKSGYSGRAKASRTPRR